MRLVLLSVLAKTICLYTLILQSQIYLLKAQSVTDEECPSNPFVRTINQPTNKLFTARGKLEYAGTISMTVTLEAETCAISLIRNSGSIGGGFNCTIGPSLSKQCTVFDITSCQYINSTFELKVTLITTQTLDEFYNGSTITIQAFPYQTESIQVINCSVGSLNEYTSVNPQSVSYGGQVTAQCINGSTLVQGDNPPTDNPLILKCGGCGLWETNHMFSCVKALFTGATEYVENTPADFTCDINENAFLSERPPHYFLDGKNITNEVDGKTIKYFDHLSTIQCVMFLNNNLESGIISDPQVLHVKYGPNNIQPLITPTNLFHNQSNGILLNESQTLNLSCVADASPAVDCIWSNTERNISYTCEISVFFGNSSNVSCIAFNVHGSLTSSTTVITIVGARTARITRNTNKTTKGDLLELSCDLPFANELNTAFKWNVPNTINTIGLASPTMQITEVTKFHTGVYKCETNDKFGNFSKEIDINVLYQPYDVIINSSTSDMILESGSHLFLNSTQNVLLSCASDANPAANCTFQIDDTTDILDGSCVLQKEFNQSANVTCTASNEISSTTSKTLQVAVVQPRNEVDTDLSPTNNQPIAGEDLTLDCSIPYHEELNTTFSWTVPSDRVLDKTASIIRLIDLTRFDLGDYTCTTIDAFGQSLRTKFLDVHYAPQEVKGQTTCHWNDVINGSCHVNFTSNPKAEHYVIQRQGQNVVCPKCSLQPIIGDIYTQQFTFLLENAPEQTTFYQVHILSPNSLLQNLTVEFQVTVGDVIPPVDQTGLIVGCVVGGAVAVAIVIAVVVYFHRRNQESKKCDKPTQLPVISNNDSNINGGYEEFQHPVINPNNKDEVQQKYNVQQNTNYVNVGFDKQVKEHAYETELPSADGTYEAPLKEEHKYAEIRNRKGSYEITILRVSS